MLIPSVCAVREVGRVASSLIPKFQARGNVRGPAWINITILTPLKRCSVAIICGFVTFLAITSGPSRLFAQASGSISGHATDATGAVIPDVIITLTNVATGAVRHTVSTTSGDYAFPAVAPGSYLIKAAHTNFKTATSQNIEVQVSQALRQDFTLQVGEVTQTVTVQSSGVLLQVESASLGQVVEANTIAQLPLNGENYLSLVALSSNVSTYSPAVGVAGGRLGGSRAAEAISVGGQRIVDDYYTLDGINNTDVDFNTFVVQPSIDAIAEMKVQTGVYSAEYGHNASQINVVTKSGGNKYHGSAFEFLRNNYADALGYNYNPTPLTVLPYKYNDYGFVLDGPLTIPHVVNGRDKLFFMVNKEWYSQISFGQSAATFPSQNILNGDFSQYLQKATQTSATPIYDPATGNPDGTGRSQFECNGVLNVICPNRIDPTSANIERLLYHSATVPGAFTQNYPYGTRSTSDHDGFIVRADYNQSTKLQWAFRFSDGAETDNSIGLVSPGGTNGSLISTDFTQYMGSSTWTISPTLVNVARIGFTHFGNSLGALEAGKIDVVAKLGIPDLPAGPAGIPANWGIPGFSFGTDPYSGIGDSGDGPYVTNDHDWSFNDNLSWVRGKHSIDVGFEYDPQTFGEDGNTLPRGAFSFQPNATAKVSAPGVVVAGTGSGFADFLLGDLYQSTYAVEEASANYVRNVESAYFNDNYKVAPKLTLLVGLRYELTPPWHDTLGTEFIVNMDNSPLYATSGTQQPQSAQPNFLREGNCADPYQGISVRWVTAPPVGQVATTANTSPVNPAPACANGQYSNNLMATDYANWAPRVGLSYSPSASWVFRIGYGMYYNQEFANARFDIARNLAGRIQNFADNGTLGVPTIHWSNAVTTGATALITKPYSFTYQSDHKTTHTHVFEVDIQKQLGSNLSFEIGYVGTLSRNLYGMRDRNWAIPPGYIGNGAITSIASRTPYPNYGSIQDIYDFGFGNYNSFAFKVTKRYSNGVSVIGSYTYSKSLDDSSSIRNAGSQLFPQNDLCIPCEYAPSDFDVRHRVVASVNYSLPIGAGKLWAPTKALDLILGEWEFNTIATFQTGRPYNVGLSTNNSDTDLSPYDRPNRVVGVPLSPAHRTISEWFNTAAFAVPTFGYLGNTARGMLTGPGIENFDMALHKSFNMPYNEHHQLQIRFETFNTLNHVNPGVPSTAIQTPSTYGRITSQQGNPRELQLAAKYVF